MSYGNNLTATAEQSKVYLIWFGIKETNPKKYNREREWIFINCYYSSVKHLVKNNNTKDWLERLFSKQKNNQSTCGYQIELNA